MPPTPPDNPDDPISGFDDDIDSDMSDAELKLLRSALQQHGLRLAALEDKLDRQMADLANVQDIVRQAHNRMKYIINSLGLDKKNGSTS